MEQKAISRTPDFESIRHSLRAWVNTTRDGSRTYLVVVDYKTGAKQYLNAFKSKQAEVEAQASPSQVA